MALVVGSFGCSSKTEATTDAGADSGFTPLTDAGACGVTTRFVAVSSAQHVDQGTPIDYPTNPPCGGNHYPVWATWGVHDEQVPKGNFVHNLEHGGVAFFYRCASHAACPDLAAKVEALAASLPQDPTCSGQVPAVKNRVLVLPLPDLPEGVQVAAAAWQYTLVARCLDEGALRDFYLAHFGRATENICADGAPIAAPDAGLGDGAVDDAAGASDAPAAD